MVLYVTRPGAAFLQRDPVLARLAPASCEVRSIPAQMPVADIVAEVASWMELHGQRAGLVVIIDAFLGFARGDVSADVRWSPDDWELDDLLTVREQPRQCGKAPLKSLLLAWALWAMARDRLWILVNTNGVQMPPRVRCALSDAFADGSMCRVYDWQASERRIARLAALAQ